MNEHGEQRELREIVALLRLVLAAIEGSTCKCRSTKRLKLGFKILKGGSNVANTPITLNSDQKEAINVAPLLADGSPDLAAQVSFSSSDPSVGLDAVVADGAGNYSAFILTPGQSGAATITVSAPGYDSESVDVSYAPLVARKLNISFGQPVSDL
jgi:hypothetical protein